MTLDTARTAADSVADHVSDHNTLHAKANSVIDLKGDHDATGDGVADDTSALVAAFAAATGKTLVIPDGTYLCSQALAIDTDRTNIHALGDAIIEFTAATNGLHLTAQRCHISGGLTLRAGHTGCLAALKAESSPKYLETEGLNVDRVAGMSWETGFALSGIENAVIRGGEINAHDDGGAGTITNLITLDGSGGGTTFLGVSLKGRNTAGEFTARGIGLTGSNNFTWIGGVIQGGFSVAAVDVDGSGLVPLVTVVGPHIELTGGGGVGYRYDNSTGQMTVIGSHSGEVLVGPTANAWDFSILGGSVKDITLEAFAKTPKLFPAVVEGSIVDNGASHPVIGSFRTVGQTVPESEVFQGSGQTYTPTNVTTDRVYDANSTTVAELADVLGTLIADLQGLGLVD